MTLTRGAIVMLLAAASAAQTLDRSIALERNANDSGQEGVQTPASESRITQPAQSSQLEPLSLESRQQPSPRNTKHRDEIDQLISPVAKEPTYVLRCWQEGRLILQRAVAQMPHAAESPNSTPDVVISGASSEREMRLFDLKNALCMVQKK